MLDTALSPRTTRGTSASSRTGFRPDIQGLRAIAVGLVVVYHLYPSGLSGGFVGVDVFFVISGYLITDHLARGLRAGGRVGLADFWGRRARRLLPAAAVVLTVTWLVSLRLLPATQVSSTAEQVRASALYFQNWILARDSVDYLARENQASPVQHFWSLSVEEQFYLVWPLLFLLAAGLAAVAARSLRTTALSLRTTALSPRRVVFVLAAVVFAASLVYSIVKTGNDPAAAYFVTPTRMWELALGGLVAMLPVALTRRLSRLGPLAWLGLVAVVGSAVWLSGTDSFPGAVALLPAGGAALLLACGSRDARLGPAWLTSTRPFVFVGDISYALYLWHWPIIVLWLAYSGGTIGRVDGPVIVIGAVILSWLTKVFVEDPVRRWRLLRKRPAYSLALVATVLAPVLVVAVTAPDSPGRYEGGLDAQHPGGAALVGAVTPTADYLPTALQAKQDLSTTSANGCQGDTYDTEVKVCTLGDTTAPRATVALVGDSHAGQWSDALDQVGRARHWKIVTVLHGSCAFGSAVTLLDGKPFTACETWKRAALQRVLALRPETVITTDRPSVGTPAHPDNSPASWSQIARGVVDYSTRLRAAGIRTVAIRETPEMDHDVPDCLSRPDAKPDDCHRKAARAIQTQTPMLQAHDAAGAALPIVDMNDVICGPRFCDAVVGNVVVYRDSHHLTKTYTRSIAPFLGDRLVASGAVR